MKLPRLRKYGLLAATLLGALAVCAAAGYGWASRPLALAAPAVAVQVYKGSDVGNIVQALTKGGVQTPQWALYAWLRVVGVLPAGRRGFKAGEYELARNDTPRTLARKLLRGEFAVCSVRLGEGWTLRQVRAQLAQTPCLRHDSASLDEAQLARAVLQQDGALEGWLFPDTYRVARHSSELALLRAAQRMMQRKLDAAWSSRAPDVPLQNPYELLKLASIVEKETGLAADRARVAAVFANRLRKGMRLQTDPTVIYGLGQAFDGNLRRIHLETDTPYNSYTRAGLPPTPIALPGEASLAAAANPADTQDLYFVARGDGSSAFSATLQAHNRAVQRYILKRR